LALWFDNNLVLVRIAEETELIWCSYVSEFIKWLAHTITDWRFYHMSSRRAREVNTMAQWYRTREAAGAAQIWGQRTKRLAELLTEDLEFKDLKTWSLRARAAEGTKQMYQRREWAWELPLLLSDPSGPLAY
jgi:hypothetical protein